MAMIHFFMARLKRSTQWLCDMLASIEACFGHSDIPISEKRGIPSKNPLERYVKNVPAALAQLPWPCFGLVQMQGTDDFTSRQAALQAIAQLQKEGQICLWLEKTGALSPQMAKNHGVCIDDLLIMYPTDTDLFKQHLKTTLSIGSIDWLIVFADPSELSAFEWAELHKQSIRSQSGILWVSPHPSAKNSPLSFHSFLRIDLSYKTPLASIHPAFTAHT